MAALKINAPLTARIKKLMQSDDDVGKVAKASPVLIAKALDIFLYNLVQGSVQVAESRGARTLTSAHLKEHVKSDPLLDFIKDKVASAPDLPPQGGFDRLMSPPKSKRPRTMPDDSEGGTPRAGGRGRGRGRGCGGGRGRGRGRKRAEANELTTVELEAEENGENKAENAAAAGPQVHSTAVAHQAEAVVAGATCTEQPEGPHAAAVQHPGDDHTAITDSGQDMLPKALGIGAALDSREAPAHDESCRGGDTPCPGDDVPQSSDAEKNGQHKLVGGFAGAAPAASYLPTALAPQYGTEGADLPEEEDYDAE